MTIFEHGSEMNTREDFIQFLEALLTDLRTNAGAWENVKLETFLEAMACWTAASAGYYRNMNLPEPVNVNWKAFADILMGARVYE